MTERDEAIALVLKLQECFNTRQFDQVDDLVTPDFFSHPLGVPGIAAGKEAWRTVVARFPAMRVVAEDIMVDGDKVAIRSTVEGTGTPEGEARPELIEIFRINAGRLAETWGVTGGPDPRRGPR